MYRLIYKSRCSGTPSWVMMRDILAISEENNSNYSITGALLASSTHFLQVLEGSYEAVNKTFYEITQDSRHKDIQMVSFLPIHKRLYEHWGMKGIGVFDFNEDVAERFKKKYGEEQGGLKFPTEEWAVLALMQDIGLLKEFPSC